VLTSNLGSAYLADLTIDDQVKRDQVMTIVRQSFKPEFLNRLDEIVLFDALGSEELTQIVALQIHALQKRLTDRRITLDVGEDALEWLAMTGYDPVYGARPLRRLVQSAIGDELARGLLSGDIRDGDTVHVRLSEAKDTLELTGD
jgi:ATP-dependent Clp protease ATP-binding subunit ClpB